MKKSILLLSTTCAFLSLFSCNNDTSKEENPKEVSEEEWKEAVENIVNYKKNNKLNYIATGDLVTSGLSEEEEEEEYTRLKRIECNDKVSLKMNVNESGDSTLSHYFLKEGYFYFRIDEYTTSSNKTYSFEAYEYGASDFFNAILDIYDYQSYFNFTNNRYIIKDDKSEIPGCKFYVELEFENKKIKELYIDYVMPVASTGVDITIKGTLNFTYGTSTLTTDSFPAESNWSKEKEKYIITLDENNSYQYNKTQIYTTYIAVTINAGASISGKTTLAVNYGSADLTVFRVSSHSAPIVYKNNVLLTKAASSTEEGDYYFDGQSETIKRDYSKLIFKESLKENDSVEVFFKSSTFTSAAATYYVS